jgi:hypothetical protein
LQRSVTGYNQKNTPDDIIQAFKNERVSGQSLFLLSKEDLCTIVPAPALGERVVLAQLIEDLKDNREGVLHCI